MSEQTEVVEGQGLARAVLETLDRGEFPDWGALDRTYSDRLLRRAAIRLRQLDLHRHFTPEDVLHGFLQDHVYPPRQARKMFARSARGERPLGTRLLASLGNYCTDLARSLARRREQENHNDLLVDAPARSGNPLPTYEEVEVRLHRQMAAIRAACPPRRRPHGAAYREALFLRQRLDLAGGFDGVELRSERDGKSIRLDLPLLERLTDWAEDERATPLVEGGLTLGQLWQQVQALMMRSPNREVGVDQLAPLIPASRDLWNQWICRGRRRVQENLGADGVDLFAEWAHPGEGA